MARRLWTQHLTGGRAAPPAPATRPPRSAPAIRPPRLSAQDFECLDAAVPALQRLDIDLMGKPRQTRRDQWVKRPCVLRYRAQCDHLRLAGLRLPMRFSAVVFLSMPSSWSLAERRRTAGLPHLVRPDGDNISKGLMDALAPSDAHLWDGRLQKRWGWHGRLLLLKAPIEEAALDALIAQHTPLEPPHAR